MPEAAEPVDHPVFAHFRKKDPKTGKSVHYDPNGKDGWPGAKSVFSGVPGSDEVEELKGGVLQDITEGTHGPPLIGEPLEPPDEADDKKPATRRTTSSKEN